jgi:hypothetical protein
MHIEPLLPHAAAVGVTQVPLLASQQPWQLAEPHEHERVVGSQASPAGQSALLAQMQAPLEHT